MATFTTTLNGGRPISPGMRFVYAYLFPWFFILPGAILFYAGLRNIEMADLSTDWPTVSGTVQSSQVVWSNNNENHSNTASAQVVYTYEIHGTQYTSDRVLYGDVGTNDIGHANTIVSQYPAGQAVTVHYDSTDPSQAVLQTGVSSTSYFLSFFGLFFVVGGLIFAWVIPSALASSATSISNAPVNILPPDSNFAVNSVRPKSDTSVNLLPPDQKP